MWILDEGPLGHIAAVISVASHWDAGLLNVSESVAAAASASARADRLLKEHNGTSWIVPKHSITPGTDAWEMLFTHLRARLAHTSVHYSEHETIAICACDRTDLVFVTEDKAAALIALSELGRGRVASAYDVWDDLRARNLIEAAEFSALCQRIKKKDQAGPGVPWRFRRS